MDREAFAKLLPEQAPAALTKWASTQESELGSTAYTVYRCERRYQTPAMEDLFENRTRGSRYWATLCNCTVCGEEWYTRKGRTAASFFVIDGEDGNTYSAEPTEDPLGTTDELYYVEVTEGDSILCPFCGTETKVVKATTIGDGKTKRLQIAQLANIDGYTTIIYWLAENQIYQYGSSLTLAPRYAYALDEKGQIKAFSHRQYLGYSLDGEAPKWRPWDNTRDKWDSLYCDWGSINGRKKGTVGCPSVPFDMEGATGEKTGLAGYWQAAQGLLPLQYLRLWQKCPAVENLVNAGFADLLGNILSDANRYGYDVVSETEKTLDLSKRRPHEMLGLSKEDFRKIDRKIEPEDLRDFRALRKLAPKASVSRLLNMSWNRSGDVLIRQIEKYGGSIAKYEGYFRKQEIPIWELQLLADTRRFAQELHPCQRLTEEELWPRQLRETHDRLSAARVLQLDEGKSQRVQAGFDAVLEKYGELQWTDGELEILLPKSNQELVREGQVLRHCVGTYGESHAKGEKIILFVRHHRRPERCYYTLNISFAGDRPREVQLHGYGNEHHGPQKQYAHKIPAKVRAFVDRWEQEILIPWFVSQKKEKSA